MKYLLYTMLLIVSLGLGTWLASSRPPATPASVEDLVINQRIITAEEIQARLKSTPYHFEGRGEFLEDQITKELLLQEAQRQNIHQEEAFRQSLQEYYEQSLRKILIDRMYQSLPDSFSSEKLEQVKKNMRSKCDLTVTSFADENSALKQEPAIKEDTLSANYLDLPEILRDAISNLQPGQTSPPFQSNSIFVRVTLHAKQVEASYLLNEQSAELIKQAALEELKRQEMQRWLTGLRDSAQITIPASRKPQE